MRLLFVYGTLRGNSGHEKARWLATVATLKGGARMPGRLADLGDYPGLLPATNGGQMVRGELWELPEDAAVLEELDRYEGCHADDPEPHPYCRIQAAATGEDGARVACWTYLYQRPTRHRRMIANGDWLCRD